MKRLLTLMAFMVMLVASSFAATSDWLYVFNQSSTNQKIKFEKVTTYSWSEPPTLMCSNVGKVTISTTHQNLNQLPSPSSWRNYTLGTEIELEPNQLVYFKAGRIVADRTGIKSITTKNEYFSESSSRYIHFSASGAVNVGGNIMSLLDADCEQTTVPSCAFYNLFKNCSNVLFRNLTLPATKLDQACYYAMFNGCTSLKTAPELPATTLASCCYSHMFQGCTSLETAPVLPATSLPIECYYGMFENCSKLNSVAVGFTDWNATDDATTNWLKDVAATGTFTCDKELKTSTTGESYVPNGWTVNNYPDYLCFTNREGNYSGLRLLKWKSSGGGIPDIQYSKDRINWTDYTTEEGQEQGEAINFSKAGEKVFFKAKNTNATFNTINDAAQFIGWGAFDCSGNIMSLLDETCRQTEVPEYAFNGLFAGMSTIYSAPKLPATTLNTSCYQNMFYGCSNLTIAPELPATTLAANCYNGMFNGCTSLSEVTVGFTDWNTSNTTNWLGNVAEEGTFRYPSGLDIPATRGASTIPSGWMANRMYGPLCFTAQQANTKISFEKIEEFGTFTNTPSIRYSTDGSTWNDYTFGTEITLAKNGDKVYFSADDYNHTFSEDKAYIHFTAQGKVAASGSIMSLIDENCQETEVPARAFRKLFESCVALTTAPQLPATKLSAYCYHDLFSFCSSLTEAPELPAKQLAEGCYYSMFSFCNFTTAPELPATTLEDYCYAYMFGHCSQLTTAPVLPAEELKPACYIGMFYYCPNLNSVTVGFTNWNKSENSTYEWLRDVAETGTFQCTKELDTSVTGISGIPEGWSTIKGPEKDYLCFEALQDLTFVYFSYTGSLWSEGRPQLQYSTNGITWKNYRIGNNDYREDGIQVISLENIFDKVYFRAKGSNATFSDQEHSIQFNIEGQSNLAIGASGNIMSLLDATCEQTTVPAYAFNGLFSATNNTLSVGVDLPATTLGEGCYKNMFKNCKNIEIAPQLPAKTLAKNCYQSMFEGCSKLYNVTVEFTDWKTSSNATTDWLKDVKATGSFWGPADLDEIFDDGSHIPTGWNRGFYGSTLVSATAQNISKLIEIIKNGGNSEYSAKYNYYKESENDTNLDLDDVEAMKCAALGIHYCPTVEIGGVKWATMNLGAYYSFDAGDYYAWGATESYANQKKSYDWSTYCGSSTFVEQNPLIYDATTLTLKPEYDAAHVNWGGDWRMPTKTDFENLFKACGCDDPNTYFAPTVGPVTYVPSEKGIYSIGNSLLFIDGSGNKLYLPLAGHYIGDYPQNSTEDLQSGYWASTLNPDSGHDTQMAYGLWQISKNGVFETITPIGFISRCWGLLIRPVK